MPPMRRAPRALLSILAAAPLLVGAPTLAQSPAPVQVLDVEWTLSQLAGEAVPDEPAITATFATDGSLTGSGGCNDYSATWNSDGEALTVTPVLATFKACSEEVDARESSYFALIQDAASWSLDGSAVTVTTNSGETLVFGDEAEAPDALALVGDWTLATVDGQAPPAGMVVSLSIGADGRLTGVACNTYNAGYTATETGDLAIDPINATRMSCGDAQDAFESSYLDGLQGAIGWGTQIGKLTLFGAAEVVFGDGSAPDATLTGQEWSLVTIGGAPIPGSGITATFGEDGTVTGSGGCNDYTGPYTVDGESLSVGPLAATRMSCGPVTDDLERTYLEALEACHRVRHLGHGPGHLDQQRRDARVQHLGGTRRVERAPGRAERAPCRAEPQRRAIGRSGLARRLGGGRRRRHRGHLEDDRLCRLGPARRHARHRHHVRRGRHLLRLRRLQRLLGTVVAERHQPVHQRLRGSLVGHL